MDTHCQATTKDRQPCRGVARPSGFCFAHDPDLQQARHDGAARGGQGKSTTARLARLIPSSLRPTLETLFTALDEVHDGTLDPRQASAMASLASAIGRLYETASIEQRLEAIEKMNEQNVG